MAFADKDNEEFKEVELAGNVNAGSHFFIEGTNSWSLWATYGIFVAFIIMHVYASIRSPPLLASKDEYFALNNTEENVSIDVDITLSQLQNLHRFIDVNGSLIRKSTSGDSNLEIEISERSTQLKNYEVVKSDNTEKKTMTLHWNDNNNKSSVFPVLHKEINDYDSLQCKLTVQTNYKDILGFDFHWQFSNPSAEKYSRAARLLMSFLIGYMLVVFAFYLKFDAETYTQIFCIILGIAGVFASNPLSLLLPASAGARISDHILMAVFTGVFRMFMLVSLELLRSHSTAPKTIVSILLGIFFGFYATVDAAASYDRANLVNGLEYEVNVVLSTEKALAVIHCIYIVASIAMLIAALIQNGGANARRNYLFTFCLAMSNLVTIITGIYFVFSGKFMFSVVPTMLNSAVNITCAAFCLFFLHPGGGPEYKQMDGNDDDQEVMVLDIEQASDADSDSESESDDDDEDEKENK